MVSDFWRLSHHVPPFKLRCFAGARNASIHRNAPIQRVLDAGCGNHSATTTRYWLPQASYVGLDNSDYNNASGDYALMERFVEADLDTDSLDSLEDEGFDLILLSHVIEHLHHGERAVARLARKLRPGGYMYVECPSERSLHLPSGRDSLNFHDDPTHVRVYDLPKVCSAAGLTVIRGGIRRDWVRALLGVTVLLPAQIYSLARYRKLHGPYLWDVLGFAQYVVSQRPAVA
jgi:SAM-dependent methyltransferase